jgi:signal transduction histidine kinase/DNA-binding response OmpR family regulator
MRSRKFHAALRWLTGVCMAASLTCAAFAEYLGPSITSDRQSYWAWPPPLVLILFLCVLGLSFAAVSLRLTANGALRRADRIEAAARAANDERMLLLANTSQELRTPLTCILGHAELMAQENDLNNNQMTRLARLSEAGSLMRNTLNRVMDLAHVGDRVEPLDFQPCDVRSLVASCIGMVEAEAMRKGLQLITTLDPATPPQMILVPDLVQQVLLNLLMNAVKFTERGVVELRLAGDATRLWLEVADTGQGMAPHKRRALFRGGDEVEPADYRVGSIGLGLSITEHFVLRMGGRIGAKENPGGGCVSWVDLPTGEPEAPIVAAENDVAPSTTLVACDLDQLVAACLGMVEAEARRKGLELISAFDPSTPHRAMLAHDLVQQVLVNLLMNAVKFTAAGIVTLRIKGDTERLRFEVADMGPGIPAARRRSLFRKSDRSAPDHDNSGPDLLWIIERFVSRMGGQIGVAENPEGGTVFWLVLPTAAAYTFVTPDDPHAANLPTAAIEPHEPLPMAREIQHLHILLADDMELTRLVTTDYLRSAGHTVTEVADGETAIAEVEKQEFDVVLTDMRMPIIDGLEVTRRIRALPGQRGRTPVVLLTANLIANDQVASGGTGVDVCVMKPFTRAELLAAVETAARLMPVPERHSTADPLIDRCILIELRDSLGEEGFSTQVEVMVHRIEYLLALLGSPDATQTAALRSTLHDLGGGAGLFGLTALSACLRRFDIGYGGAASAAALQKVAIQSVQALRQVLEPVTTQAE